MASRFDRRSQRRIVRELARLTSRDDREGHFGCVVRFWHKPAIRGRAEHVGSARVFQKSTWGEVDPEYLEGRGRRAVSGYLTAV